MLSTGIEPTTLRSLTRRSNLLSYAAASSSTNIDLKRSIQKISIRFKKIHQENCYVTGINTLAEVWKGEEWHDVTPKRLQNCNAEKVKNLLIVF